MRTSVRALVAALALLAGALKTSGDFDVCNNIPCTRLNYGFTELELWYDLWGPGYWDGDTWVLEPLFEYTWDYDLALSYGYCDYRWDYELWYGDSEFILRTYSLNYVDNTLDPDPNVYWYPFDDTKVLEFGSWSPDPAGVCAGETFTQTRSVRSLHRTGLRNECGEERNVFEEIVNSTGSQDATGSLGVSAIAGPTVICPYADGNPAGFGCDGAHFSVLVTPARPNVVVNWTGGVNPGSSITDGNGMSIYTMRFLNSTSSDENRVVTATISGTSCPSVLPVLVRGLAPTKPVSDLQWGQFIQTGSKPIREKVQSWTCANVPLGLTEMNFVSYAAIGCDCSTNGAKVLVFGAMRFIVGDYWYGSDIIDYRGRPDDVAAVIAGEGQHYDSYAVYAITARQYWYDIRSVTYSNELLSLYAAIELKRNMDAVGNLWMSYNRSLDAVGGPHKTLGSAIRCGRCPEYCH